MSKQPDIHELEQRLAFLEERLERPVRRTGAAALHPAWPLLLGGVAVAAGLLSVGYPRHYYQILFSLLLLMLLYHRGNLLFLAGKWKWPVVVTNFALLCLVFQFLIGGGVTHPFDWIKVPVIHDVSSELKDQSWYSSLMPEWKLQWQTIPRLAEWELDITKIQTFLLLTILAGSSFRFEPFTSIAALALLILSLPVYLRFDWDWVVPFITAASVCFYLQTGPVNRSEQRRHSPEEKQ